MTVLVTPVGTSLFTNYLDKNRSDETFKNNYDTIKKCPATEWDNGYDTEINNLRCAALAFIENSGVEASAELQSIAKIRDELKDDEIEVRLFASDTIASRLAAEILMGQKAVLGNNVVVKFKAEKDVIEGLQIKSTEDFSNRGMPNLMRRISQLDGQLVINITGGYKANGSLPHYS